MFFLEQISQEVFFCFIRERDTEAWFPFVAIRAYIFRGKVSRLRENEIAAYPFAHLISLNPYRRDLGLQIPRKS
jgi:hypothetical protein